MVHSSVLGHGRHGTDSTEARENTMFSRLQPDTAEIKDLYAELGCLLGGLKDTGDSRAHLSAIVNPMLHTFSIERKTLSTLSNHRIVKAETFVEAAITTITRIRHNDVVEGTLLGARTRQANDNHGFFLLKKHPYQAHKSWTDRSPVI